jgi:PAT family beta-lactamase induction signal transducer AmpG
MKRRSPWFYVPSLYFQQGLPVILVQQFSVLLYKKLGISNDQITFWTSLLAWPWVVKMFWGPVVDLHGTKRSWTLWMQLGISVALFALAAVVMTPGFWWPSLALLLVMAFLSATHDIALDGYYLVALEEKDQAFFMGITSMFFRLSMIFCTGTLVILAGLWERSGVSLSTSWSRAVLLGALIYAGLALYARKIMPHSLLDHPAEKGSRSGLASFSVAFSTFFTQDKAIPIVLFILLYRFGESMLSKMSGLFLLDSRAAGGLGFDSVQAGTILGSCGVIALVTGGLLGGIAVSRLGLKRCIWPMALFMHIPNLLYVWAAYRIPSPFEMYFVVGIDQFAYGFGLAAYMVYTMSICRKSQFQASHYAMVTALMAFGAMLAGMTSGWIQSHFGYAYFFISVCVLTLPGMFLLFWIPIEDDSPSRTVSKTKTSDEVWIEAST